jgi:hypothetical protein
MLKKILIATGILIAVIVILLVVAGIIITRIVDKSFIESRLSQALNRQVKIEKIDVSIFSFVSGIEIKKMIISNFKTPSEIAALKDNSVAAGDVFVGMEALRFKIKFLPLFRKQFELDELVLYSPVIYLARSKHGVLNCDDLIKSKKQQPAEKADLKKSEDSKEAAKPITVDDIPLAITVGKIGIKNGTINYHDGEFDQKFQVYNLTTLAYDINVDPKDLAKKDEVKLKIALGLKTVGPMKTGSVQAFDITIDASGKVIPFDTKTRQLEPEIIIHAAFPEGQINGLQIFNAVAAIPLLGDYLGEHISFLKGKQEWKNSKASYVDLRYKAGRADISNGNLDLKEAKLLFAGMVNTDSKALDMKLDMVMKKEINNLVKSTLAKKIDSVIKNPEVKRYADANKLAEAAMQPLLNKDGLIDMKFKAGGTTKKTDVKLVQPQLDSLDGVIKKSAGNVLLEAGKSAGKKLIGEDRNKILENTLDLLKK